MTSRQGQLRIGASGYQYDHWQGPFYPDDLPKKRWFEHYAEHFDTVEINNTFYNLPKPQTFDDWREASPAGFCYALKFSRYGTHMKKLKDPQQPIGKFLEHAGRLGDHLGPILVQLPPNWHVDVERLDAFLDAADASRRWAIELRDESWLCDEVYEVLRRHGAALCIHDMRGEGGDVPRIRTADWMYLRFHGPPSAEKYAGSYSHQALTAEAQRIRADLDDGVDVYAYFNNDAEAHAVHNARDLRRYVDHA